MNIDEPLAVEVKAGASYTPYYYHADGLGSITGLSDATGTMVQTYSYDAFGQVTASTGISQPFAFTGREYDSETGMYFYRARYYDPVVGRFVTRDPIGFAGGDYNLYGYVGNNPINFSDSDGLFAIAIPPLLIYGPPVIAVAWMAINEMVKSPSKSASKCEVDNHDICYERWDREYSDCNLLKNLGQRTVNACRERAAIRRDLCYRNGGKPHPLEPPQYSPFRDYPR